MIEKKKSNKKKKNVNKGKILLNNINDLIKIPINELLSIDVNKFSGDLYTKIYDEALRQEEKKIKKNSGKKNNVNHKKSDKKLKNDITRKNSYNSRTNIFNIKDKNDDFSSEEEEIKFEKMNRSNSRAEFISQSEKRLNNHFNNTYNANFYNNLNVKKKLNFENWNTFNNNNNIQLYINNERNNNNFNSNYNKNQNLTDRNFNKNIKTDNNINQENNYIYSFSDNINKNNNNFDDNQLTKRFYSGTINYKHNLTYNIKRINFEINYISQFGEEVGILGSIFPLGNWEHNRVIRLKWNNGHIWKGGIYVNNNTIQNFEFKFVILQGNKIKKWEPGENNKFNYNILLNLIKKKRNGFYDKYNYEYNIYNDELTLTCKWNY